MDFMLNGRDEPRVLFDYREFGARAQALKISDPTPFEIVPHPTGVFFQTRSGCGVPKSSAGFAESASDDVACAFHSSIHPLDACVYVYARELIPRQSSARAQAPILRWISTRCFR
jgi:hypothetical protein